jgi:hypothetical protein
MLSFTLKISWLIIYWITISATPPLLIRLDEENLFVLMTWKLQIALIFYVPLAYIELKYKCNFKIQFWTSPSQKLFHIIFASLMYLIWFMGLLEACRHSIILHALLMNNLGIFIAPVISLFFKDEIGLLQKVGFIMAWVGVCILFYSTYTGQWILMSNDNSECSLKFDIINICCSIAGYLHFRSIDRLEKTIPKVTLRTILAFVSLIITLWYWVISTSAGFANHISMNINTGIFGWVYSMPLSTFIIIVVSTVGWALGNFNQTNISVILFLEPLVGQYLAVFVIKIDVFPASISLIGALFALIGMYIVREEYEYNVSQPKQRIVHVQEDDNDDMEYHQLKNYYPQKSL